MPSKFTENYHLSQWEPEDNVLRTDFNEDNAKIETALGALADSKLGTLEIIWTYSAENPVNGSLFATVSGGWNRWAVAGFLCSFDQTTESQNAELQIYDNDDKLELARIKAAPLLTLFFPLHDETRPITGLVISSGLTVFRMEIPFKNFDMGSLNFLPSTKVSNFKLTNFGLR